MSRDVPDDLVCEKCGSTAATWNDSFDEWDEHSCGCEPEFVKPTADDGSLAFAVQELVQDTLGF